MFRVTLAGLVLVVAVSGVSETARAGEAGDDDDDADLDAIRNEQAFLADQVEKLRPLKNLITGYIDIGFFAVSGDGSGIRSDVNHTYFPEYEGVVPGSWVFMGDPLSTAVNARGEPPTLGDSRALLHDSLDTGNGPSFAINAIGLTLSAGIGRRTLIATSVDLVPRDRDVGDPSGTFLGDFLDVKRAYAQFQVLRVRWPLFIIVGKFHSILGREYATDDAPGRVSVTPSLICRYTCGNPIGVKAHGYLMDRRLSVTAAITNGSYFISSFAFSDELDDNLPLTGGARVAWEQRIPLSHTDILVEIGVSGAVGPQDEQGDIGVLQWQWGLDLRAEWDKLVLSAELVDGEAQGETRAGSRAACDVAPCLDFTGAAAMLAYYVRSWVTPYVRADWRDALHRGGVDFVYVSKVFRGTAGLRFDIGTRVIAKAEYTHNRELGRIPQFGNDIFTSALIVEY